MKNLEIKNIKKLKNNIKLCIFSTSFLIVTLTGCKSMEAKEEFRNDNIVTIPLDEDIENQHPIVQYFEQDKVKINNCINNSPGELGSTGCSMYIEFVDFIFYDKEINGYKYADLDDETKSAVYSKFCNTDRLVCMYGEEGYKNQLGYDYIKLTNYLDTEYYSQVDEIKDYITPAKVDSTYSEADVINYFDDQRSHFNYNLQYNGKEETYNLGHTLYEEMGDFIFADTEVYNYKFSELSSYGQKEMNDKFYGFKYVSDSNGFNYSDLNIKYFGTDGYNYIAPATSTDAEEYDFITVVGANSEEFERSLNESSNIEEWYCVGEYQWFTYEEIPEENTNKVYKIKYKEK